MHYWDQDEIGDSWEHEVLLITCCVALLILRIKFAFIEDICKDSDRN